MRGNSYAVTTRAVKKRAEKAKKQDGGKDYLFLALGLGSQPVRRSRPRSGLKNGVSIKKPGGLRAFRVGLAMHGSTFSYTD